MRSLILALFASMMLFSCQQEITDPNATPGGSTGGGGSTSGCNNVVQKLKKMQGITLSDYIELGWKADGNIDTIRYHMLLSEYLTARYQYTNGKISSAILFDHRNGNIYDTAIFRHNAAGKVDSMYLKNDDWFDMSFTYDAAGKLVRFTRYASGFRLFYWTIETDANGNITKAVEYYENGAGGYDKQSTYTFTRDTKKNPFANLTQYMMYLHEPYVIFRDWGANNYIDQRYIDHTGLGIDLTTGNKFTYNANCYPANNTLTMMGSTLGGGPDFNYIYN